MSQKETQKNFELSASFSEYVVKHPEVLDPVPKNAQIIMGDSSDPKLTTKNRKILGKKGVFQAVKQKRGWELQPI